MSNTTPFREAERTYRKTQPPPLSTYFHPHPEHTNVYISSTFPDVALLKSYIASHTQQEELMHNCVAGINKQLGFQEKGQTNLQALYYPLQNKLIDALHETELRQGKTIQNPETIPNRTSHEQKEHTIKSAAPLQILQKLRWATIGYNYNWTTQLYDLNPENTTQMPLEIQEIARTVCAMLQPEYPTSKEAADELENQIGNPEAICSRTGKILPAPTLYREQREQYEHHSSSNNSSQYTPDTGIINFYPPGTSLTGHVDRSEINLYAPLVSISLGRSCTFLLGGFSVHDATIAPIQLESGDVFVMWGSARRRFHGVPVIANYGGLQFADTKEPLRSYMQSLRININVRQMGF